ncbi:MAG: replicative DNA helicase, partial [Thermodesulfobacteriota bacterium]|nr:replicative DNA helicase [Thermodesulfobacteriota bacterium]
MSIQKLPPQNLDAEQSVLGAVLLDNDVLNQIMELIGIEDFYKEIHRKIYSAMLDLYNKNEPNDLITLTEMLRSKNQLEDAGSASYLASLVDNISSAANVKYYAKIVKEKSILRKLINNSTEIITKGYENTDDVDYLLDYAENAIFQITQDKIKPSFVPLETIIKDSMHTIETISEKKGLITGIPTGSKGLDQKTAGLQKGDLVIIAGRPGMGKTAFSLDIAQHTAMNNKTSVAIFSLEMSKDQLGLRMLCSEARVNSQKIRSGFLSENDWIKLTQASNRLYKAPIFIDDTPGLSILEMRAKARRLKAEHNISLIIVDYLQLMSGMGKKRTIESREQEISEISRFLKGLARELNVSVVALSQLNRQLETRTNKRPQLADLRESGAIEQDADLILFLYRDELYPKGRPEEQVEKGIIEVIIGK